MRHFLKETDFSYAEACEVFNLARELKADRFNTPDFLSRQSWGLLFYKSSTRTRVSFEVGINEMGGFPIVLNSQSTQIGRGESVEDTAKVLSRFLHGIIIRTYAHDIVETFANQGNIPVVNALTDFLHPCQIYSDFFTLIERWSSADRFGPDCLKGKKIAFLGDTACNMANSLILGAALFGIELSLSGPHGFAPGAEIQKLLKTEGLSPSYQFNSDPEMAVKNADMVYTDVWVSMGMEDEAAKRIELMQPYSVTADIMRAAKKTALFMHCLPAHPGQEVSESVLQSPQSIVFDQAENRLHTQKAILGKLSQLNFKN
jgi:ornithine carbamoyltransferase